MFFLRNRTHEIRNLIISSKSYCTVNLLKDDKLREKNHVKEKIEFFIKLLELPNRADARQMIEENKYMLDIDQSEIVDSFKYLQSKNISIDEIKQRITVLAKPAITLQNHREVLLECGFTKVDASSLVKYIVIMNKRVKVLKNLNYIPFELNVPEHLASYINVELPTVLPAESPLKQMRQMILNVCLRRDIGMNDKDLRKLWKVYHSLRHKSYQSIYRMIKLLQNELNFSNERIISNLFVLYADPDNVENIMRLNTLGGMDAAELLNRRPKIMMTPCSRLLQTELYMREFGIDNLAVSKCIEVFTLSSNTVQERLHEIKNVEEFDVLQHNPRILRLVHYQMKARARLEYLKQLKVKCVSLHVLSSSSETFERYAREGADRTKGFDLIVLISQIFNKKQIDVRNALSRHPNWCYVPVLAVKQTCDQLKNRGYDMSDIYQNIHILLYPIDRIDKQLKVLNEPNKLEFDTRNLTKNQRLCMAVYLIELEFHFTGDGIWLEPLHQVEPLTTPLPEMPSALYKHHKFARFSKMEEGNYLE